MYGLFLQNVTVFITEFDLSQTKAAAQTAYAENFAEHSEKIGNGLQSVVDQGKNFANRFDGVEDQMDGVRIEISAVTERLVKVEEAVNKGFTKVEEAVKEGFGKVTSILEKMLAHTVHLFTRFSCFRFFNLCRIKNMIPIWV
jgi:hypothetical protein